MTRDSGSPWWDATQPSPGDDESAPAGGPGSAAPPPLPGPPPGPPSGSPSGPANGRVRQVTAVADGVELRHYPDEAPQANGTLPRVARTARRAGSPADPGRAGSARPAPPRRLRLSGRPLHWITGYQPEPVDHRAERLFYSALALGVLVTVGLAAFSISVVLLAFSQNLGLPLRVLATLGWAAVVFTIELLIVRQIGYRVGEGFWVRLGGGLLALFLFLIRLALAFAVALLVAEPLIAYLFNDKVQEQLATDRQNKVSQYSASAASTQLTAWLNGEVATAGEQRTAITTARNAQKYAAEQVAAELRGTGDCGNGQVGPGKCYQLAQARYKQATRDLTTATTRCERFVSASETRRRQAERRASTDTQAYLAGLRDNSGMLDRLTALTNIEAMRHASPSSSSTTATTTPAPTTTRAPARAAAAPDLAISCDPKVPLPNQSDVRLIAANIGAAAATGPGNTQPAVTRDEANYIWRAHLALLVILLVVDLFPLLTKQWLRFSLHAQRVKARSWKETHAVHVDSRIAQANSDAEVDRHQVRARASVEQVQARWDADRVNLARLGVDASTALDLTRAQKKHQVDVVGVENEHALAGLRNELAHRERLAEIKRLEQVRLLNDQLGIVDGVPTQFGDLGGVPPTLVEPNPWDSTSEIWIAGAQKVLNRRWQLLKRLPHASAYAELWFARDLSPDALEEVPLPSDLAVVKLVPMLDDSIDRWEQEVRAVQKLPPDAPHIAPMLDAGSVPNAKMSAEISQAHSGLHYMVQPYYPLGNLDEYMRKHQRPTLQFCLVIANQVLKGLQAAHVGAERLHLDIKPTNIVMAGNPAVPHSQSAYIIDWGLATPVGVRTERPTGRGRGSLFYSAPEQFIRTPDRRSPESDVYAVGATLYWLLTGRRPLQRQFAKEHPDQEGFFWPDFLRTNPKPDPVHALVPSVPLRVSELVSRWLSMEPSARVDPYDKDDARTGAAAQAREELKTVVTEVREQLGQIVATPRADAAGESGDAPDGSGENGGPTPAGGTEI